MSEQLNQELDSVSSQQMCEQQRAFVAHVFDGDKKPSELCALKHTGLEQFSDEQRLQVYRNNIVIGLRGALAGVYPVIKKLVGNDFFEHVAREYIHQHPSRSGNLHAFGNVFSEYLAGFPGTESLPYLPDVARFEWAYHQAFHAQEDAVLNIQKLSLLDEEANGRLKFQVSSSCCLFSSGYPVLKIWQMNQEGVELEEIDLAEGGVQLVVRRLGFDVVFEPLNKAIFTLLRHLSEGHLFVEACAEVLAIESECDVGKVLKELIERRLLTGFSCS